MSRMPTIFNASMALAIILSLGIYMSRSQQRRDLLIEQQYLKSLKKEHTHLTQEIAKLRTLTVDTNELSRLRSQHRELIKLRSDVSSLRQQTDQDPAALEAEIIRLENERQSELRSADRIEAQAATRDWSKHMRHIFTTFLKIVHRITENDFPRSFTEFHAMHEAYPKYGRYLSHWLSFLDYCQTHGYPLETTIEFIPHSQPIPKNGREHLIIREINPRLMPDGTWARYYGTTTVDYGQLISPQPDFNAVEAPFLSPQGDIVFPQR